MALELRSLPEIHPRTAILIGYGPATIFRLSIEPTAVAVSATSREVRVDWVQRPGDSRSQELTREISWRDVPKLILDAILKWRFTKNERVVTEEAAIGVMAMLIDDLEDAEILHVLPIGSGGDYLIALRGTAVQIQAESSGILIDSQGYESTARLKEKGAQVLSKSASGFASVTAFSHSASRDVRCKISFVGAKV